MIGYKYKNGLFIKSLKSRGNMFKINKKIEYALIVLKHFDDLELGEYSSARQISDLYHTPFDSTSKVMQIMNNNGVLKSAQGVGGGYLLACELSALPYLSLAQMIEGKTFEHNCNELKCSLIETCTISGPVTKLNDYLNSFFKNLTIKELLQDSPAQFIQKNIGHP